MYLEINKESYILAVVGKMKQFFEVKEIEFCGKNSHLNHKGMFKYKIAQTKVSKNPSLEQKGKSSQTNPANQKMI